MRIQHVAECPAEARDIFDKNPLDLFKSSNESISGGATIYDGDEYDGVEEYISSTWYLHLDSNPQEWTRGPDLSEARGDLTCSFIAEPFPQIVIVGGKQNDTKSDWSRSVSSNRVDILDLEKNTIAQGK